MKTLTQIALEQQTDKARDHKFTDFYDKKLSHLRYENINLLEIGIWKGESLRTWKEYFPNASIYGVDISNLKCYEEDRIQIEQADQTDVNRMNDIFGKIKFDIIIDDGGHSMYQQQLSLISLFHRLKKGGFYILEDLHTSLEYHHFYNNDLSKKTALELIKNFSENKTEFGGFYVPVDYIQAIYGQVQYTELFYSNEGKSITSILKKNL
jgi:hypothetical protein